MDEQDIKDITVVPGLEGIAAAESSVCYIDGLKGVLEYRGYPIEELTEKSSYLEIAYLLVFGKLPTKDEFDKFSSDIYSHTRLKFKVLKSAELFPENGHPMDFLQSMTASMGMYYPARDVLDEETRYWSIIRLIAKLPTMVAASFRMRHGDEPILPNNDLSFAANFYYMLFEKEPDELTEKIVDVMFTLHAEHSMNASTFSARVVGSTLADPYTVVSSAIGTLSGPLHGGANEKVLDMLEEIGTVENARAYITEKIDKNEKIMGVGHRVYKTKDPRAIILEKFASKLFESEDCHDLLKIAKEVEKVVIEKLADKKLYPNVDFYSGVVFHGIGIPSELYTSIFAAGRVSGWLAHWLEQLSTNRIYRPTQKYVGGRELSYKDIKDR